MDLRKSFLTLERMEAVVQIDPALFLAFLALTSWFFYKLFLKDLSKERHKNLRTLFRNLLLHSIMGSVLFVGFTLLVQLPEKPPVLDRITPYVGFLAVLWGALILIKTCRIFLFEYLFLLNMQTGVPLLLVNLFTLILSIMLGSWILSAIFQFQLVSLVATSAVLSILLGLALQDTLGNLFAGVALQLDKPYAIGDWIEIINGTQKVTGIVQEVTWRATILISVTEEVIIIPNRLVAGSQVNNFSGKAGPVIRSQVFRIEYGTPLKNVREILLKAAASVSGVRKNPSPVVFINESTESYLSVKLIYYIDDFGKQFLIADQLIEAAVEALIQKKINIAPPRLQISQKAV